MVPTPPPWPSSPESAPITGGRPDERAVAITHAQSLQRLIAVMAEAADSPGLMRSLVLEVLNGHGARAAALAYLDVTARLRVVGAYGFSDGEFLLGQQASMWAPGPLGDAIRHDRMLVCATADELLRQYPEFTNAAQEYPVVVSLPVRSRGLVLGAVLVALAPGSVVAGDDPVWSALAELSGWHLRRYSPRRTESLLDSRAPTRTPVLSDRQLQVLQLMEQRQTNSQIATRLGYSTATVRADALHIFREFQVHSRHDAVRRALEASIIDSSQS